MLEIWKTKWNATPVCRRVIALVRKNLWQELVFIYLNVTHWCLQQASGQPGKEQRAVQMAGAGGEME